MEIAELLTLAERQITKLQSLLTEPAPQIEPAKKLAQDIGSTLRKAITFTKNGDSECIIDSPGGSPRRKCSERVLKDHERKEINKKRKTLPKWTRQVVIGVGPEPPLEDGYSWRKYGQKAILGAGYPRGYFRCTHRGKGCLAMKQVQRSDSNPMIFDITYRGKHTCYPKVKASASSMVTENKNQNQEQSLLMSFKQSLKVKTEGLDPSPLGSTPVSGMTTLDGQLFSCPPTMESQFIADLPSFFISPSASDYYYPSPYASPGGNMNVFRSDVMESMSGEASVCNSPELDMDFLEFDRDFQLDNDPFFM